MIYAGLAWGTLTHIDVFILGTIPFTVLGWMFFFVPLTLIVDGSSGLFRLPMFNEFILAEIADFNREIELTRENKRPMKLLDSRAKQKAAVCLEEAKGRLGIE